jgi:TonB family protein
MRARFILAVFVLSFLTPGFASVTGAASGPLHTFYGQVKAIDLAAKTITIKSNGKSFLFHITNETKISSAHGYVRLDKIQRGQGAAIVMRPGADGKGLALSIRFDHSAGLANFLALYSVKTTRGDTISGIAFNNYVEYEPRGDAWKGGVAYERGYASMFLLLVRPDGTVYDVKPLRGLGHAELDARAVKWLKQWRFRPNSITEARIPVAYSQTRS